jgi:hypothetical protein
VSPTPDLRALGATAGGQLLRTATALVAAARSAAKPLHPRGDLVRGTLSRSGALPPTGVPWLDDPGEDDVLVRVSRAVGLPSAVPDIHGLALRVPTAHGYGDVLLASTGTGRATRFVLTAARRPGGRPMTTLLPYRTPAGPVLLAATEESPGRWALAVASPQGAWRRFATLTLSEAREESDVSFDPVRNTVPGLEAPDWVCRLREPAYRTARRSRPDRPTADHVR